MLPNGLNGTFYLPFFIPSTLHPPINLNVHMVVLLQDLSCCDGNDNFINNYYYITMSVNMMPFMMLILLRLMGMPSPIKLGPFYIKRSKEIGKML
jgi:hypothetical protein